MVIEVWRHVAQTFLHEAIRDENFRRIQSGFSGSVIVKVSSNDAAYALRSWLPQTFPVVRIRELHRFLSSLRGYSLPVAVPLQDLQTGQSLLRVGDAHWQLEPWLAGRAKSGDQLSEGEIRSMMQTIARIHLASERYVPSKSGTDWFQPQRAEVPAIRERLSLAQSWTAQRVQSSQQALQNAPNEFRLQGESLIQQFQAHASKVSLRLSKLAGYKLDLFPCWRDLWGEHVLFLDGNVSGVIDPTAMRIDHVGTDLSRLLGSLFQDDKLKWNEALQYYQNVRPLTPDDLELIRVLDQSSVLLSGLTWLDRWERQMLNHDQLPAIVERLRVIVRRMRRLDNLS